jgi:hypothetical protein
MVLLLHSYFFSCIYFWFTCLCVSYYGVTCTACVISLAFVSGLLVYAWAVAALLALHVLFLLHLFLVYLSMRELLQRYLHCMCYCMCYDGIAVSLHVNRYCSWTFHFHSIEVGSVYLVYCYCMLSVVAVSIRLRYCKLIGMSLMLVSDWGWLWTGAVCDQVLGSVEDERTSLSWNQAPKPAKWTFGPLCNYVCSKALHSSYYAIQGSSGRLVSSENYPWSVSTARLNTL